MKTTETPRRYGRTEVIKEERNAALLAVPAASTNGSTGRQQVRAARTLPTAESAAASAPFEEGLPVGLTASVFMDARSLAGLSALPDEPSPLVEDRPSSIQDTNGNSARNPERPATLQLRLSH